MKRKKRQQLKALLRREKKIRNKFASVRDTVVEFIDELNTHDNEWQNFWAENIGSNSTARFSNNDKIIILAQPKKLYKDIIWVEGIFYKNECTIIDYVEEEKPIELGLEEKQGDE